MPRGNRHWQTLGPLKTRWLQYGPPGEQKDPGKGGGCSGKARALQVRQGGEPLGSSSDTRPPQATSWILTPPGESVPPARLNLE